MKRRMLILAAVLLGLNLASATAAKERNPKPVPSGEGKKAPQIAGVEQFKADFQRDRGKVRLVTLLSPT